MITPLPNVETTCSYLEQEESQREILGQVKEQSETLAMYSKGTGGVTSGSQTQVQCTVCSKSGHTSETYWFVIGSPNSHPRNKSTGGNQYKGKGKMNKNKYQQKWSKGKNSNAKVVAHAQGVQYSDAVSNTGSTTTISVQLLKLLPTLSKGDETDEEMDVSYSGMLITLRAQSGS